MSNKYKAAIFGVLGLIFVYIMLNWAISSIIHGKKEVMIPDLKGKSITDAVNLLSPLNLGLKKDGEENDERLPVGTIVRQSPLAGMTVREGKIIRVIVSQGGKVLYVPSVLGQMARSAEIMLRSSGLTIGEESTKYSLVSKKDEVISQDPAAGQSVERDAMVNMVISLGAPPQDIKLMPDWNGKKSDEALRWAAASGISLEVRREKNPGAPADVIFKQEPALDTDITESKQSVVYVSDAGGSSSAAFSKMFRYEIPQGAGDKQIRLTMQDDKGEQELFRGSRPPGSKLELPINQKGNARIRIFINNILVEERKSKITVTSNPLPATRKDFEFSGIGYRVTSNGKEMNKKILMAPSILSADFSKLAKDIALVEKAGADWLHIDVMDGHFVPNLTIGPVVIKSVRPHSKLLFDVHLMIESPEKFFESFVKSGADLINFHCEAKCDKKALIADIRKAGAKAGISIRPSTDISRIYEFLPIVDLALVMTVEPGFAGQKFKEEMIPRIRLVRDFITKNNCNCDLQVDGGINEDTALLAVQNGANVLVAGQAIYGEPNPAKALKNIRKVVEN